METLVDLSHWGGLIQGTGYTGRKKEPNGAPETTQSLAIAANCFSCWGSGAPGSSEPGVFGRTWDNCDDSWQQLGPLRQGLYRGNWSHGVSTASAGEDSGSTCFLSLPFNLPIFHQWLIIQAAWEWAAGESGKCSPRLYPPRGGSVCVWWGAGSRREPPANLQLITMHSKKRWLFSP